MEHSPLNIRLLCCKLLFHDKIVEIATWVDRALFMQTTLLHVVINLIDEFFAHLQ